LYKINFYKQLSFEAGPSFGYLIGKRETINEYELDIPFNNWDIGLSLGLYYALSETWQFNIRYFNTLFFPVRDHASGASYWLNRGQYNEVLSFTFHYQFNRPD
jgi:hypothetical protein